jgi:hypothetical protein
MDILQGHKKGIIGEPEGIFPPKSGELFAFPVGASTEGISQKIQSRLIEKAVIDGLRIRRDLSPAFLRCQKPLAYQGFRIYKVRVSGKSGKGLVGRIPVACRTQGKDLSKTLSGSCKIINEFTRFP